MLIHCYWLETGNDNKLFNIFYKGYFFHSIHFTWLYTYMYVISKLFIYISINQNHCINVKGHKKNIWYLQCLLFSALTPLFQLIIDKNIQIAKTNDGLSSFLWWYSDHPGPQDVAFSIIYNSLECVICQ